MAATNRNSTLYLNHDVNKEPADARDRYGRVVPLRLAHTVVTGEDSDDTVNLGVIPANWEVVFLRAITDGLGVSAGAGVAPAIGDSGDADRYMKATDFDAAEASGLLAFAGQNYRPTADTIILMTYSVANPVVGKKVEGIMLLVPA